MIGNFPLCQIVSGANGLVIEVSDDDLTCYTAESDTTNRNQLWQLIEYPDGPGGAGFALATTVKGFPSSPLALSAEAGVEFPILTSFVWSSSWIWQLGEGLSPARDSNYCLTMQGGGPWPAGTRIQMYQWHKRENQLWTIRTNVGS